MKSSLILLILILGGCTTTHPSFVKRENSPNFRKGIFHNTKNLKSKSWFDVIKMRLTNDWADWPDWIKIQQNVSLLVVNL